MKVLFTADDFGLTKGVTDGIIKSHVEGIVNATSIVMNGLSVDYAIMQLKKLSTLKVGVHLVLTWGKPVSNDVSDLIDADGFFKLTKSYSTMPVPNLEQIEKEWTTQIDNYLATGLPLNHLDSHHHIHGWPPLKNIIIKLASKYKIPVRYVDSLAKHKELLLTETVWLDFYADGVNGHIFDQLKKLPTKSVEVMTHPAFVDQDLKKVSSYVRMREDELAILCKLKIPEWVKLIT